MKTSEMIKKSEAVIMQTYGSYPLCLEKAKGSYVYDVEGKKYLDFASGIAVNALGHGHEGYVKALKDQLDGGLIHCSNLYYHEQGIKAAEKMVEISGLDRVFFCNSGAEAVEGALKLARKYGKKYKGHEAQVVIAMENSFHGRSYGAVSLTGQKKYQKDLNPLVPHIVHVPFNDIAALKKVIEEQGDKVCGIFMEPIQGEGGVVAADKEYVKVVRQLCDEQDILMIFDEVQTGIGRTGKWFGFQHLGVKPDVVALAKGLGGGFPVGALMATEKGASAFGPGDHASTYGGNPLATTAVKTILDTIEMENLLENVQGCSDYLKGRLEQWIFEMDLDGAAVRGQGLLMGIYIPGQGKPIIKKAMEKGLLLVPAGEDVIRFLPPLNVTKGEIEEAVTIFEEAAREVLA